MNRKLAVVGVALVFTAVAVGSGAFTSGDEVTNYEANGSVFFSPADTPTGDAYADFEDGRITLTVERLNPQAETLIDELFEVGYEGDETAEVWVEHPSDSVTFYDSTGSPVENETEDDRIVLDSGEVAPVGMSVDTRAPFETVEQVTLVALIPDSQEDGIVVTPPGGGGGGGGGGGVVTEPETGEGEQPATGTSRLDVNLGQLDVRFRQPEFEYTASATPDEVGINPGLVTEGVATVLETDSPEVEETVVVEGTVENTGSSAGTAPADLRVNGRAIRSRSVELGPGENTTLSFAVAFDEPGRYEVAVGESEPVTVFVTEEGIDLFPWALVAAVLSVLALFLTYRRWKEDEDEPAEQVEIE